MNSELTENVQQSIRPGEMVDTYYYGETNCEKQAYPCVVNNKFKQQFTNLTGGTSQFVISPYQGVSDIVGYFKLPAASGGITYTNACLPQAWAYSLIRQVSVRYGSSAQYFFTGAQLYLQNLMECENGEKRLALSTLGGQAKVDSDVAINGDEAYFYLNLPHNSPRADGKPLPLPSDLLVQPIVITIELNPISSIFLTEVGGGGAMSGLPTTLSDAWIQVKQEMMSDSADLLARRVDMNTHAYTYPLKYFPQQEVQINVGVGGPAQSVNLTGFRAGEVRDILLWLTSSGAATTSVEQYGPDFWYAPENVVLTYNGEIFYRGDSSSYQMWNLIGDTKESGVSTAIQDGAGNLTSEVSQWVDIPFAQVNVPYDKEVKLVHGKPILNAVVNLTFDTPSTLSSGQAWTLHAVYIYNSSLLMSRGSAEYIF
jgi:hypothetical protein